MISDLKSKGTASYNIISMITDDCDLMMQAAADAGMTGENYVWLGFDGCTAGSKDGALEEAYEGFFGTNIKYASVRNPLYLEMATKWAELFPNDVPWADETNVLSVLTYTAQAYDALKMIAQAATDFRNA